MKKLCSLFIMLLAISSIMAQAPQLMNFQGVARNSVGNVLNNKNITVRLTVHDATATGTALYSETRAVTTNAFGLFNIVIGSLGTTATTGSISTINWLVNNKYLQLEIDPLAGSAFTNIGTTQLVSVPYAFSAGQALPSGPAGGSLAGTYPNPTIGAGVVTATNMAAGVIPTSLPPNGPAGGSLAGSYPNPTVATGAITAPMLAAGVIPTTLPPSGAAGGDLSGTYPNPSLLIPLTKTSAQTTNALVTLNNSATTGILGALQASSASTTAKAVALQGTISSTAPGPYSIAVNGVNNGIGSLGIGVSGVSMGSGWGVYGLATLGGSNAAGVLGEVASSATSGGYGIWGINNNIGGNGGYFKNNSVDAASRALLTNGAIQHTGIGEALGKVLTSDAAGNATWQNLPAGTGITGSGTLNYLPKFTPSGTVLGNSQVFDDASGVGIGTATPTYKLDVLHGGGTGIRSKSSASYSVVDIDAINGDAALRFYKIGSMKWNTRNRPTDDFYEIYQGGGSGGSRMVISQAGDVGINQSTPTAKLYVNGSSDATQTLGAYSFGHQGLIVQNATAVTSQVSRAVIGYAANSSVENQGILGYANGTGSCNNEGSFNAALGVTSGINYGIYAYASNSASSNVGILATVPNGANDYAAILNGKVQIQNGTEAAGKVLTSDAVGTASWQNVITPKVGISLIGLNADITIPTFGWITITNFTTVNYEDGGANFNNTTGEYTIPVAGVYQINASVLSSMAVATGWNNLGIFVNGVLNAYNVGSNSNAPYIGHSYSLSLKLAVGDKVKLAVGNSGTAYTVKSVFSDVSNNFSINLIH